jgi:molybdopterin converting factor subunit 1
VAFITVRVKLFGYIREATGMKEMAIHLDSNHTGVNDLKQNFYEKYPKIASNGVFIMVTVNRKVANDSTRIASSDEVALLPLVSGG